MLVDWLTETPFGKWLTRVVAAVGYTAGLGFLRPLVRSAWRAANRTKSI